VPKVEPFEQYSDTYDQWFEENRDKYEAELEVIRRLHGSGCGLGTIRRAPGCKVRC